MFVIKSNNEYLSDILKKILNSYSIIENLSDQPNDLELLEIELKKINGFLLVLEKKVTLLTNSSVTKKLENKIRLYFQNYDFSREIILLIDTYSNDNLRVRNIRNSVINSLDDGKLMNIIHEVYQELK
uniref:Uncharacterized protein n=1 Tax=uncultured marine thaumarchaeote KM3_23_F10 TaxID=1456100 RepID=A0A075GVG2_9ARCH|nr:hypothetical protein [uncultured marine thaumarchaeote KM3_23_F10]